MNNFIPMLLGLVYRFTELLFSLPLPRAQRWKAIQQSWNDSSSASVNTVLWLLGIVVGGVLIFAIVNGRRDQIKRREREQNYFLRKAAEKGLDQQSIKFLSRVSLGAGLDQPYRILDSFDMYSHAMDTFENKQDFSEQEHQHFHQAVDQIKEILGFTKIEDVVPLEFSKDIKTGQILKLRLNKEGQTYEYEAELQENEDKFLALDASKIDFDFIEIGLDTPIEVTFHREADAGYFFHTTIARVPDTQKKRLFLKHPGKLERKQARNFSRMDVSFPFSFYHLPKEKFNDVEIDSNLDRCRSYPNFRGETVDISGGGLSLHSYRKVKEGDFLYLNFQMLNEEHGEPLLSEVVWSGKEKVQDIQLIRVRFFSITEKMQDELMKFVYQMQRRFARRLKFAPKR